MLLNEMMQMFQSEILQVDTAPPFDIHFQINGQERKWIVGKGHGLLHQCEKISFYLPPSEEFIEVRILRTAFGCQEKMIASVGIPSNRYLYRKVYIQTDIEHNHNMVFKIEVVEWP